MVMVMPPTGGCGDPCGGWAHGGHKDGHGGQHS